MRLPQGWDEELRNQFYHTPQGSLLFPYEWFLSLEAEESGENRDVRRFAHPDHLERYGLIPPDGRNALNPDGLPIGFAVEPGPTAAGIDTSLSADLERASPGERWVGLTCAACHTADATVRGRSVRLDGAPARFDFDSFYRDFAAAVQKTLYDPARFERFADQIVGPVAEGPAGATADVARAKLRVAFAERAAAVAGEAALRRPALESGFGRVDALTQIVNSIAARDQQTPANLRAPAAPTSYPPLWLTPRLEFVQWNPIAANPLARNGGQTLGVFGRAALAGPADGLFDSSVRLHDLHNIETWVRDLEPPAWDESIMGEIDRPAADLGRGLYERHCVGCHALPPYPQTDPAENSFGKSFIPIKRVDYREVGTDPAYVESLVGRLVLTSPATAPLVDGEGVVAAPAYFSRTVGAVLSRAMAEAGLTPEERADMIGYRLRPGPAGLPVPYTPPSLTDVKAGPLPGVWATGPYLHNGSVPTVEDLLKPPADRRKVFWTGARELDLERLGYVSEDAPGRFRFDTELLGNGNGGHEYPPGGLAPDDRSDLIEFLKTL
ncbi:di-heme-cytochrome C peroxidase [Alienimonas californiensis]|uniref:Cytochrome c n=1 Tax=Alienimonas californiensis TaxID=2527989 RepID=A0A517PBJ9_9PLAN|nr:di-heme-cytochrome C peroxidase [Alienimonas californiensis]QDT16758.1 Cytochrome c [Alienimonas californiensis]